MDEELENIFGINSETQILNEVEQRARELRTIQEIHEYMDSVLERISDSNKIYAWGRLFENLPIETLDENFDELLKELEKYKAYEEWNIQNSIGNIINNLPDEIKFDRYEEICEFILDENFTLNINSKLPIVYSLPVNFKNPEKYKNILDSLGPDEEKFYIREIKKNVILGLPKDFVLKNYKAVSEEYFSLKDIHDWDISNFIKDVFSQKDATDEILTEVFTVLKAQLEAMAEKQIIQPNSVYSKIIEFLPRNIIKQYTDELINAADNKRYPQFLGIDPDRELDYELLQSNFGLVIETIKARNEYEHVIARENSEIIKLLPESFIKENGLLCFTSFAGGNYNELSKIYFNNLEEKNYEDAINVINWLSENALEKLGGYDHLKNRVFDVISDTLPEEFVKNNLGSLVKSFPTERIDRLYAKVFETPENGQIDTESIKNNIELLLNHFESQNLRSYTRNGEHKKIIQMLPNNFVKENIEFCFAKFDKEIYSEFLSKYFTYNENEKIDSEELKRKLEYVKSKIDEKFSYDNRFEEMNADKCWDSIIETLPEEAVKENSEYILTLLGKRIPDKSRGHFLNLLPGDIIRKHENNLVTEITTKNINEHKGYFKYLLSNTDISLIRSEIGSKIFNFININPNNTDPDFLEMKEWMDDFKKNIQMPDMDKYSSYLPENYSESNVPPMETEIFESFLKDLENIKLLNGRIPEEYCDYIIKQKITKDSVLNQNLEKYLPMLKRAFEDKVQHMLSKEGIEGYTIEFFEKDGNTLGYHNKATKTIGFLEENLTELDVSNSHIINTAYHEVRHAIQAKYYNSTDFTKLDGTRYNMIKEEIIRADENAFYNRNYTRMFCEIDARLAGTRGQAEYLEYLGISEEQIIETVGSTQLALKDIVENNQKQENENIEYASNKVDRDGNIVSISQKASELIGKKADWLKEYPVLALEFEENGERRKTPEILSNAISCTDISIKDIYTKILETEIQVSLEDAAVTLDYVSKLLETKEGYSDDVIKFTDLVIKNEIFASLRGANIDDIECKRVFSLLNKIAQDNPDLEISKYINEKINQFLSEGKIEFEVKRDSSLSDIAISSILGRDIKTKEEFEEVFKALSKVMLDKDKSNFNLQYGFKDLFEKYFKNDPTIDFNLLLGEALEFVSESNRISTIEYSWNAVPEEQKIKHIDGFINLCSQYRDIDFEFIFETASQLNRESFEENEEILRGILEKYIPQGMYSFLKAPRNKSELEATIKEAESNGAQQEDIEKGIAKSVINQVKKKNPDSVEMLYTQLEFVQKENWKANAITTFFLWSDKKIQKEYTIQILKHALLEKEYFAEKDILNIIKDVKKYIKKDVFKEVPDLDSAIDEIQEEAMKKAKERKMIKSEEDLAEKLNAIKLNNPEEWRLADGIKELMSVNLNRDAKLDFSLMLDMSLKMFSNEFRRDEMMMEFWKIIPEDMKAEQIKSFVKTCGKHKTIDFSFAYDVMERFNKQEIEENPEMISDVFGEYLSPGLMLFLKKPENATELKEIIEEAKKINTEQSDIKKGMDIIVCKEAAKGNPQTLEILKQALLEKEYFAEEDILDIIKDVKRYIKKDAFKEVPDLDSAIDEIQEEAMKKAKERKIIKSEEDLAEKLNAIKSNNPEEWKLVSGIKELMSVNLNRDAKLDFSLMLDMSLKMFSNEFRREDMMMEFWEIIPEDMKAEQIKSFVKTCGKHKTIDFSFAYDVMERFNKQEIEENPEMISDAFGEYLSPGLMLFLKKPENAIELKEIIEEAKKINTEQFDIKKGMDIIVCKEAAKGNPQAAEMLYTQVDSINYNIDRQLAISTFFIYASKELKLQKTEEILRHTLVDKSKFDDSEITLIVSRVKSYIGNELFEENPNLLTSIDRIQEEALERKHTGIVAEDLNVSEEPLIAEKSSKEETEEMLALQKIRENVPATDISIGKKMIQQFLSKAKEMKKKIGKFFGGGDNYDDR